MLPTKETVTLYALGINMNTAVPGIDWNCTS